MKVYVIVLISLALVLHLNKFARAIENTDKIATILIVASYIVALVFACQIFWGN